MTEGGGFFLDQTDIEPPQIKPNRAQNISSPVTHLGQRNLQRNHAGAMDAHGPSRSGCSQCVSLSYSEDLYRAFGVYICGACRKDVNLISKVRCCLSCYICICSCRLFLMHAMELQTTAKQQYLLTDGDLRPLGSLERKNPRKKDWNPMKLYMESQVKDVAYAKYGGQAGLEWEARVKVSKKLESRIQVRWGNLQSKVYDGYSYNIMYCLQEKERKAFEHARKSKRIKQIHDALTEGEIKQDQHLIEGLEEDI